jgi:CTD kinase subunit gamma
MTRFRTFGSHLLQVLQGLQGKGYLESQAVIQIEDVIKERETNAADFASPNGDVEMTDVPPSQTIPKLGRRGASNQLDKRQIEQRIEEDRERHKRERESIWAIPKTENAEMNRLWEETSDFGEDDDRLITEEQSDFQKEMEMQSGCHHHQGPKNGDHR